MRSGIASKELFQRKTDSGTEFVLAQVPSFAHGTVVGAATLYGVYCPTCTPSPSGEGPPEHGYTNMRHEKHCARTRAGL